MEFYHKNEFESIFPNTKIAYPSVLKLENNLLTTVLNNQVLDEISDVEHLIESLHAKL